MISRKLKSKFSYVGYSESGEMARIDILIGKIYVMSVLLLFRNKKYIIPISSQLIQKYELVNRINRVIENKQEESLSAVINKKDSISVRHFPISLSYDNRIINDSDGKNLYSITISLTDSNSILIFPIHNFNEMISFVKEGMIFPGDKSTGLEVIELSHKRGKNYYWKTKCLFCGKETTVSQSNLKINKSCGCLAGKNFNSVKDRFLSHVDKQENIPKELQIRGTLGLDEEPCWLWTRGKDKNGYGKFLADKRGMRSHRYSWEIHNNERLDDPNIFVCHRCDNPACVNPSHLFKGTNLDNMRDMVNKGRDGYCRGEKSDFSRLTESEVLSIRAITGKTQTQIAKEYEISISAINKIVNNKTWKHV